MKKLTLFFLFILLIIPLALAETCPQIGQIDQDNNMYCGLDQGQLTWLDQKPDYNSASDEDSTCQQSYECLSLKCFNGLCGGQTYEEEVIEQESFFKSIYNMLTGACSTINDCYEEDSTVPFCRAGTCEQYCSRDSECTTLASLTNENLNFCDDDGYCVQCTTDTECTGTTPYCDADGDCVECTTSTQDTDCEDDEICSTIGNCIAEDEEEDDDDDDNGDSEGGGSSYSEYITPDEEVTQQQSSTSYCGDGTCYYGESYSTCPQDCPAPATQAARCGDRVPNYPVENCENCPIDVRCESGEVCKNGECVEESSFWTVFIIILILLALGGIIFAYIKMKKKKPKTPITPAQQIIHQNFFKKKPNQVLMQRSLVEQRRQRQFLEQRKQQLLQQQKKQQEELRKKQQQATEQQQIEAIKKQKLEEQKKHQQQQLRLKQQQLQAQKREQDLITKIKQQQQQAKAHKQKIQTLLNKKPKQAYKKDLLNIAGIGEKTANNIIKLYPTKTALKQALARGSTLPFKKIIIQKLKRNL